MAYYEFPKYITCPKCGNEFMSHDLIHGQYGHDVVGSTTVVSSSSGYSFKKGVAGALVFGPVGAVAGIGGKRKTDTKVIPETRFYEVFECHKCGYMQKVYKKDRKDDPVGYKEREGVIL